MTEQRDLATRGDNIDTVDRFLFALRVRDLDAAAELLDDAIVYENVGFSRLRGSRRVLQVLSALQRPALGFDVAVHRSACNGATVLNERTDLLRIGPIRIKFWVCGVFEVREGRITLWRDYFDALDLIKGLTRGLAGAIIPALRPRM